MAIGTGTGLFGVFESSLGLFVGWDNLNIVFVKAIDNVKCVIHKVL